MQHESPDLPWRYRCILVALILLANSVTNADESCPPGCAVCNLKQSANALIPGVTWGADLRLRSEYFDNSRLDDDGDGTETWRQRVRARLWMTGKPTDDVTLMARLATEPWYFSRPDSLDEQFTRDEAIIDQLYVDWKADAFVPAQFRVGRQDILLGDGWLVRRGTHLDSSRTNFFDAIRTTLALDDVGSDLDLIGLRNHSNSSWFARPFNDADLDLSEQDETGAILYARNRRLTDTELDAYAIYKHDDRVLSKGSDADIYTFGMRAAGPVNARWTYRAELAPQFGNKNGTHINALGFRGSLSHSMQDSWDSSIRIGYEYRSGDDDPNGAFDILWGRYGSNLANIFGSIASLEGQSCHPSNFHYVHIGWTGQPTDKLCLTADYGPMFRDKNPFAGTPGFSDNGRFRGHLITGSAAYAITPHTSMGLVCEAFVPGDYYKAPRDDTAVYLRGQIVLVW